MKDNPTGVYVAAHFGLELDQKQEVSLFRSIEGGGVKADVMTYQYGDNANDRWRLLGKPKFDDIKLQVGMSMSSPFAAWLSDFFDAKPSRKNGAILAADFYFKERARRTFKEALIKEVVLPKLDATDKNPVYMNVSLAIEDLTFEAGTGNDIQGGSVGFEDQKHWTANNFNFFLEGYGDACLRVVKVDTLTIKQNIIEHHYGGFKAAVKTPTNVEYPNIVFYVPEPDAQPFLAHISRRVGFGDKFGVGQVRDGATMHGHIEALDNELETVFLLEFFGADIVSVTPDKNDATSEELKLCKIELYCESMTFKYK